MRFSWSGRFFFLFGTSLLSTLCHHNVQTGLLKLDLTGPLGIIAWQALKTTKVVIKFLYFFYILRTWSLSIYSYTGCPHRISNSSSKAAASRDDSIPSKILFPICILEHLWMFENESDTAICILSISVFDQFCILQD